MRDLTHCLLAAVGFPATTVAADTDGPAVDLQGFSGLAFCGTVAGADGTCDIELVVEHSDDGATFEPAPADDVYGETVAFEANAPNGPFQIGYRGVRRYVRLSAVRTAGQADLAAVAVKGHPDVEPTYSAE